MATPLCTKWRGIHAGTEKKIGPWCIHFERHPCCHRQQHPLPTACHSTNIRLAQEKSISIWFVWCVDLREASMSVQIAPNSQCMRFENYHKKELPTVVIFFEKPPGWLRYANVRSSSHPIQEASMLAQKRMLLLAHPVLRLFVQNCCCRCGAGLSKGLLVLRSFSDLHSLKGIFGPRSFCLIVTVGSNKVFSSRAQVTEDQVEQLKQQQTNKQKTS